jgi:hypothetical protein
MKNARGLLLLAVPLVAGLVLVGALVLRRSEDPAIPRTAKPTVDVPVAPAVPATPVRVASAPPPKPAPDAVIAKATDEARVRSTYQNFRTAVATNNRRLQDALRPSLLKERDFAVRLAQEELSSAPSEIDREIAQKTLEALRR